MRQNNQQSGANLKTLFVVNYPVNCGIDISIVKSEERFNPIFIFMKLIPGQNNQYFPDQAINFKCRINELYSIGQACQWIATGALKNHTKYAANNKKLVISVGNKGFLLSAYDENGRNVTAVLPSAADLYGFGCMLHKIADIAMDFLKEYYQSLPVYQNDKKNNINQNIINQPDGVLTPQIQQNQVVNQQPQIANQQLQVVNQQPQVQQPQIANQQPQVVNNQQPQIQQPSNLQGQQTVEQVDQQNMQQNTSQIQDISKEVSNKLFNIATDGNKGDRKEAVFTGPVTL